MKELSVEISREVLGVDTNTIKATMIFEFHSTALQKTWEKMHSEQDNIYNSGLKSHVKFIYFRRIQQTCVLR